MIKKFPWFPVVFLVLAVFSGNAQAAIIRINAPKIELDLEPGQAYSGEIEIENPTKEEMKLKIYLEDWRYKDAGTGEKDFGPVGSFPFSASSWIAFNPTEAAVPPFGRMVARYTVKAPPDAAGAYYSVLFFENILGHITNEEGANVKVAGRIGALFFIRIKGTVSRAGKVAALDLIPPQGNSPMEITASFQNTGNVDITLQGSYLVMDASGGVAARGELEKIYTQPGGHGKRTTKWVGRLAPGKYNAVITFDLGDGKNVVEEQEVVV